MIFKKMEVFSFGEKGSIYLFIFIEVFIEKKKKANWKYNNNLNSKLKFLVTYVAPRQCDFYN